MLLPLHSPDNGCWQVLVTVFCFVISMIFFPGEMRTVAGNGTEPVRNVDEWEEPLGRWGLECGGDDYRQTNTKTEQKVYK